MAKKRKREDKRADNEWEGWLSEKETIQSVESVLTTRGEKAGNNEDKTWLRNTFEAEGITGEKDTSVLFISQHRWRGSDDVIWTSVPSYHSRDVTALFFLVIREWNQHNSDEFNFPCYGDATKCIPRESNEFSLSRINIEIISEWNL